VGRTNKIKRSTDLESQSKRTQSSCEDPLNNHVFHVLTAVSLCVLFALPISIQGQSSRRVKITTEKVDQPSFSEVFIAVENQSDSFILIPVSYYLDCCELLQFLVPFKETDSCEIYSLKHTMLDFYIHRLVDSYETLIIYGRTDTSFTFNIRPRNKTVQFDFEYYFIEKDRILSIDRSVFTGLPNRQSILLNLD
jgi:hypothetical protein